MFLFSYCLSLESVPVCMWTVSCDCSYSHLYCHLRLFLFICALSCVDSYSILMWTVSCGCSYFPVDCLLCGLLFCMDCLLCRFLFSRGLSIASVPILLWFDFDSCTSISYLPSSRETRIGSYHREGISSNPR